MRIEPIRIECALSQSTSRGGYQCPECGRNADTMGDHQVGCVGNCDRIARHNNIRDVLFNAAQSAALGPRKEALGVVPNSSARSADILLHNWCGGRQAALDVTVISSLQQLTVSEAAVTPGYIIMLLRLAPGANSLRTSRRFVRLGLSVCLW